MDMDRLLTLVERYKKAKEKYDKIEYDRGYFGQELWQEMKNAEDEITSMMRQSTQVWVEDILIRHGLISDDRDRI